MKKYWMLIKNTWDEALVYRLNFVLWRVRVVIRFLITYFLWSSIYSGNQQFFGYSREMMLTYVLMVYLVSNFVFATRTQDIGSEINEGKLTNYLLKPFNYFISLGARDVSDKLLNFGCTVFEFAIIYLLLKPPFFFQENLGLIILAIVAFVGAVGVYFCISVLLGFLGFWTSEVWATRFIFIILFDFPVKVYLGQLTTSATIQGFGVMAVWVFLLTKAMFLVWRQGLKVYSAEGR